MDSPGAFIAAIAIGVSSLFILVGLILVWTPSLHERQGNVVNAVEAAANVTFVFFNYLLLRAAYRQLDIARREVVEATGRWEKDNTLAAKRFAEEHESNAEQLATAKRTYQEAIKSRIDASAPKVSLALTAVHLTMLDNHPIREYDSFGRDNETRIELHLEWTLQSWDTEPIRVFFPSPWEKTGHDWLTPGESRVMSWKVSGSPSVWHRITSEGIGSSPNENPWWVERIVQVYGLGTDVYDNHIWNGQVKPFNLDGSRIVANDEKWWVNCSPLAHRERFYQGIGDDSSGES